MDVEGIGAQKATVPQSAFATLVMLLKVVVVISMLAATSMLLNQLLGFLLR